MITTHRTTCEKAAYGALIVLTLTCSDAFGHLRRRIIFEDPVTAVTTRYYYDGQSVIEERDGTCPGANCDAQLRFHVNGAQFIDERVTTFEDSTSEFTYYLVNKSFSVAGMGNADGSLIERLDYSSTGDFAGGGPGALSFFHDASTPDPPNPNIPPDLDIDLRDFASFQNCFGESGPGADPNCLAVHDFDTANASDGDIDLDDYARLFACYRGPFVTPDQLCGQSGALVTPPSSGTFALHGRPLDILSDGHTLIPIRARYYDAVNGRWLQRDPTGFADGANLYGSFRNNPLAFTDPFGTDAIAEFFLGPAGKDISTVDVFFSRETLADLTFGLIEIGTDPISTQRRDMAFRQGVVSPTITAGEIALTGPAGGIRNFLLRNATFGFIFSTGEFGRDLLVEDRVQSVGEFAVNTSIFTGAGATLEGVFFVGGRVIALVRQGGRTAAVDVTTQFGQLIQQGERQATSLVTEFPAITATGEVNLLNVARRGVPLTTAEATAGIRLQVSDAFPTTTQFFERRILGDFATFGRFRGRFGNLDTRVATLNELTRLEAQNLLPQVEFFIRGAGPGTRGSVFPDIAVFSQSQQIVEFVQVVKSPLPARELSSLSLIRQAFPNTPVRFVISGPR